MAPPLLHMLLTLTVEADPTALGKASVRELQALLRAYAPEGEHPRMAGKRAQLVERVHKAVCAAGPSGFVRTPLFGAVTATGDVAAA